MKLRATSVADVLADAMLLQKHALRGHARIGLLISALRVAGGSLRQLPNTLAAELVGRLRHHSGTK